MIGFGAGKSSDWKSIPFITDKDVEILNNIWKYKSLYLSWIDYLQKVYPQYEIVQYDLPAMTRDWDTYSIFAIHT